MCILTVIKPGIVADYEALAAGAVANPHGHGWAVHAGDRLIVGHGLDPQTTITEFAQARTEFPDGPALFHSRFATHGDHTTANCHPFAIGGDKRSVLAHNGILPEHVHPLKGDDRSDTRIAAEDFLPQNPFGSLDSWAGRERFERWLGTDKAAILTVDPAYKHPAYIFNEHRGHWREGSWYSNHNYELGRYPAGTFYDYEFGDGFCDNCGAEYDNPDGPHCPYCGFCEACLQPYPRCRCTCPDEADRYADLMALETA
ncbi:class II glutamine amidotransferase [Nocardia ignorata]|uniref:Glutamine amidotransferase n=1 Tax=Nocardia ignorata TaxID=145285 RepID=A0A4R6NWH3_NOCIG|nr:class II glutamine amidotransferase [Nocardia ignorata]TDP27738.1 glutamine amidotransferase [Nocardia ignorata]